jgi:hypothetical protein
MVLRSRDDVFFVYTQRLPTYLQYARSTVDVRYKVGLLFDRAWHHPSATSLHILESTCLLGRQLRTWPVPTVGGDANVTDRQKLFPDEDDIKRNPIGPPPVFTTTNAFKDMAKKKPDSNRLALLVHRLGLAKRPPRSNHFSSDELRLHGQPC